MTTRIFVSRDATALAHGAEGVARAIANATGPARTGEASGSPALVAGAWLLVGIPILWGVWVTLQKAAALF